MSEQLQVEKYILPIIKDNTFIITDEIVLDIVIDYKLEKPFHEALNRIVRWFNDHHLYNHSIEDRNSIISITITLILLIVKRDLWSLLDQWVFIDDDLDDYVL